MFSKLPFYILSVGTLWIMVFHRVSAQVVPDNRLPNPSSVPRNCIDCEITGGTRSGNNLFHSFQQFSVPTGGRAYFNNAADIRNIFARVTGQSRSDIDGILQANGAANLFLLNPNGILLGPNASLNLGGSFYATTAERITFADGEPFSTQHPDTPLLTMSAPIGIQFGRNSGAVVNRASLAVLPGQTIAFAGNGVILDRGRLTASSGRVELGSVAPSSRVMLTPDGTSYDLGYASQNFSDIRIVRSLIDTSGIESSININERNGGTAQLQARNIRVAADSAIISRTYAGMGELQQFNAAQALVLRSASVGTLMQGSATGQAGNIAVRAGNLTLSTGSNRSFLASQTLRGSSGDAGNLTIRADRVTVRDGSRLETATFGTGQGGNLSIRARTLEVSGFYPRARNFDNDPAPERRGQVTSGISSQAERGADTGNAGNLTIRSDRLMILNGGVISTATFGGGNSGNLQVSAAQIQLAGTSPIATQSQYRSGIFVSAEPNATGEVGNLNLRADRLSLEDRAQISARNRGSGQPGAAVITVRDLAVQGGSEISASTEQTGDGGDLTFNASRIQVSGTGEFRGRQSPSNLSALSTATASGQAGNLQINADRLSIDPSGAVSVSGEGRGAAGNMRVNAGQVLLNGGRLEASTERGSGAEISLDNINLLLLQNQSLISARAFNDADGGNVTIQAPSGFLAAALNQNNDIIANAVAGSGGEITVNTRGLLGLEQGLSTPANTTNDIDASSEQGPQGIVTIRQPDFDPSRGLIELPSALVDAASLIRRTCPSSGGTANGDRLSEFVITGRGGLPPSPADFRNDATLLIPWATLADSNAEAIPAPSRQNSQSQSTEAQPSHSVEAPDLVEAQGWIMDGEGRVILTAQAPATLPDQAFFPAPSCR